MILSKTKNLFFLFLFLIVLNINFIFAEICPEGVNPCNPEIPFQNIVITMTSTSNSGSSSGGNSSWNESYANTKYYGITNPSSFLNTSSTLITNLTRLLNQNCSTGFVVNGTYINGTLRCASISSMISNTTIVRANSYNCPTGFIVQNLTANSSGVFGKCINQSLVGINYWQKSGTGSFSYIKPLTVGNGIEYEYQDVGGFKQIFIGSRQEIWNANVPTQVGIAFNGSNQFNNPPWLPQGFHPTTLGQALGFSVNSEYARYPNTSYSGTAMVLDASGNGRFHIYTYENVTAVKNEPLRIDDFNNLILQSPDYSNNGDVWIGTNNGNATLHVKSRSVLGCSGTLDCSIYDEETCDTKTEGCAKTTECTGAHDGCDSFDGSSVSACSTHDCSYSESCTGTLDCSVYDEFNCNSHSAQCSWDGMTCNNNGACSNIGSEGDCNSYNGCSWFVDCYGATHGCQQSECDSSAFGCFNSFLSCDNTATCSDILYATCNDYNGCNQSMINPNLSTHINAVGFGQTEDAYQCQDSSGVKQTYFDYNCGMTTNKDIKVNANMNITGNVVIGGNISVKRAYGMFSDNTTQLIYATGTAIPVNFSITEDSYLISMQGKNNVTFKQSGDYLIELSALFSTSVANKHVEIWVQKTNSTGHFVNVPRSNTKLELFNANAETVVAVPFIIDMMSTDKMRIMWASDSTGVTMQYVTNTSYSPETPSIILTITKNSEIT